MRIPVALLLLTLTFMSHHDTLAQDAAAWRAALASEARSILDYWATHTVDADRGGFYGRVDSTDRPDPDAPRSAVLNTRILWTFSAAGRHFEDPGYRALADRAYRYLRQHFVDPQHGGVYWSVHPDGSVADPSKQIYAQSFAVYAFAEYFHWTGEEQALEEAVRLFELILEHAYDPSHGGYLEAFGRDWSPGAERYLTGDHGAAAKTMNTHLHLLEAFTKLYVVWPETKIRERLEEMILLFEDHIYDREVHHLDLYFRKDWEPLGEYFSFGHDIEASWLLMEAAEALGGDWPERLRPLSMELAESSLREGLDEDGAMMYEAEPHGLTRTEKSWWPQAEAMVGFYNAYQLSSAERYREASQRVWAFVEEYLLYQGTGEWRSMLDRDRRTLGDNDKVNAWKAPYHNTRACLEMHRRLGGSH